MKKQIFILDDDGQMLSLLRDIFEIEGWQVTVAASISQAKECLESSSPDCFIIDLKLPDGDGSEFIHYLRSKYEAPIMAISGAISGSDTFNLPATKQMGADYHMSKPF
ncbi:MAG: response regulator, partial [Gammaproteobacteria bacterium]|nr:response regulator [Gammaproteobacteria bacterium]